MGVPFVFQEVLIPDWLSVELLCELLIPSIGPLVGPRNVLGAEQKSPGYPSPLYEQELLFDRNHRHRNHTGMSMEVGNYVTTSKLVYNLLKGRIQPTYIRVK